MSDPAAALPASAPIAVIGAGAMGAGIAQVAAAAGHPVWLHDARDGAAQTAIEAVATQFDKLLGKGKLTVAAHARAKANLRVATSLADVSDVALVIEAIVEDLDAKRALFASLEQRISPHAILATNTSSISVTLIGAGLSRPGRLVGMHFFNPAPLMALVEIISGMATEAAVANAVFATAARWGKTPVHARSTPGFIVNRVARPFYAEALRLLQEGVADVATLDTVMRECGGFRMGPFELMDLIGHDVNYAVTRSVFDAYYGDPRFTPSLIQQELVNAGFLGRKSGRGFYDHRPGASPPAAATELPLPCPDDSEVYVGNSQGAALAERLREAGVRGVRELGGAGDGTVVARAGGAWLHLTDGRSATRRAAESGCADTMVMDLLSDPSSAGRVAIAASETCGRPALLAVIGLLQAAGWKVSVLGDGPGLVMMRTVSMLANEACDAVHQGVCSASDADTAMRGGVNYPRGPVEWAQQLGASVVLGVLDHLAQHYGESRYRASPLLRQRTWSGVSLYE